MHASHHPHVIHDERLIVSRRFSVPRFVLFRVSLLHLALLFSLLPVLCPEPLLPCGQRQGKHFLRLRHSRSLALWQNSLLPHFGWSAAETQWILKEPDKATSEPGEVELLDAVAMLALNLESERRTTARDKNIVFKIRNDSELAGPLQEGTEAKNEREQYEGHPQGKRLDALIRLLLWRVAQLITDEAVKTMQDPGKQVLLNLRAVGNAAKTSADMRATRCFVEWIWAVESRPDLRELGRVLRASGVLAQFGTATEEDRVPTSKQAKLVSKLLKEGQTNLENPKRVRCNPAGGMKALWWIHTYRRYGWRIWCVQISREYTPNGWLSIDAEDGTVSGTEVAVSSYLRSVLFSGTRDLKSEWAGDLLKAYSHGR